MYSPSSVMVTGIILPVLGVLAVILRFAFRIKSTSIGLGFDDWAMLVACIIVCGMGSLQVVGAELGELGRDGMVIDRGRSLVQAKVLYILSVIEKPANGLTKISVLYFYRRIFATKSFILRTNVILALVLAWTIAFLLAQVFMCGTRPSTLWSHPPPLKECADQSQLLLWFAVTDVIGDVIVLGLPYAEVLKLQMKRGAKLGVIIIFMLGLLASIAGITRLGFVSKAFTMSWAMTGLPRNGPASPPVVLTTVEVSVAVIAGCLPALAPLLRKIPHPRSVTAYWQSWSRRRESVQLLRVKKVTSTGESSLV